MTYLFSAGIAFVIGMAFFFESPSSGLLAQSIGFYICVGSFFLALGFYRFTEKRDLRNDPHYFIVLLPTIVACVIPVKMYGWSGTQMLIPGLSMLVLMFGVLALLRRYKVVS